MSGCEFIVRGVNPAPQGSKSLGRNPKTGKPVMYESSTRVKAYRAIVASEARDMVRAGFERIEDGPVEVSLFFWMSRPDTTFRSKPYIKPDVDKMIRSTFDAISGILFRDDEQICWVKAQKVYGDLPGVRIKVVATPIPIGEIVKTRRNREKLDRRRTKRMLETRQRQLRPGGAVK